jgi:tRNA1Val (adenine37-N6)-methyltransferase
LRRNLPPFRFKEFEVSHSEASFAVNTDAVLLGAWAGLQNTKKVLEVGCGCGVISLCLAQRLASDFELLAIDIDEESVIETKENFKNSTWNPFLNTQTIDFNKLIINELDLIICNPPYFRDSLKNPASHKELARHQVSFEMEDFARFCFESTAKDGKVAMIYPASDFSFLKNSFSKSGFFVEEEFFVFPKKSKEVSRVLVQFSKTKLAIKSSELIIYEEDNSYTAAYKKLTEMFYLLF